QHLLELNNYKVIAARNGVEALKFLTDHKPTMIITDIIMPEMDGFELCRRIRSEKLLKDIPVILLTAFPDHAAILKSLESGADNFVTKPYTDDFLLSQVGYILKNLEIRRNNQKHGNHLEIFFEGEKYPITANYSQIIDLLFSVFQNSIQKTKELEEANRELKEAFEKIKTLQGFIPICAHCKKIRNDEGYWQQVETYITERSEVEFSHGLCPECAAKLYPDFIDTER
ncbi:unnamed protein product, partial [marine sediment metagenome]